MRLLRHAGVTVLAMAAAAAVIAARDGSSPQATPATTDEQQVRTLCTSCHAFPAPGILPRSAWRPEIIRMQFIRDNRTPPVGPALDSVQLAPDMQRALDFYSAGAPERLPAPESWPDPSASPLQFTRTGLVMQEVPGTPAVSHVRLTDLDGDGRLDLLGSDMRQGVIFSGDPSRPASPLKVLANIPHPAHVTPGDVDGDGNVDLLVGDLGEFYPGDHDHGAVIWLRGQPDRKYKAVWLDGWPRIADVQAADFNTDGKNDLAVAAFGWRKTGQVAVLENTTAAGAQPTFERHTIDPRPGAINVVPTDVNGDGRPDLIVLLAQHLETVLAYINTGRKDFTFDQHVIYAAPHPNWGSSGIQVVDMDKDGDLDVLLTHGDTFDDGIVKPYHGIQWLENTGGYPFVEHTLAQMPGVHRAIAADMDGDGDLDVVAGALLAAGSDVDEKILPALIWLEQTTRGTFARHTIEMGVPRHATIDVGDVDGDGDLDIVDGRFLMDRSAPAWVDVWINRLKSAGPPKPALSRRE